MSRHIVVWRKTASKECQWSLYKRYKTKKAALAAVNRLNDKCGRNNTVRHIEHATYVHHEFMYKEE